VLADRYSYTNGMRDVFPAEKCLFAFVTMVLCFAFDVCANVAVIAMMFVITVFRAKIPVMVYLKLMAIPLSFLFIGVLTIIVDVPGDESISLVSVRLFGTTLGITASRLNGAFITFVRALAIVSCLYFLMLTTSVIDILGILKKLRLPMLFLELTQLIYRLIFVLLQELGEIYMAQDSRLGYSTFRNGYRSLGYLMSSLFVKTYKDSQDMYISLEARCYDGNLKLMGTNCRLRYKNVILIILTEAALTFVSMLFGR